MADDSTDPFPKLGSVYRGGSGSKFNQLRRNVANMKLNSEQTGDSRVNSRQYGSAPGPWNSQNSSSNAWGHPNVIHKLSNWGSGESGRAKSNSSKNLAFSGNGNLRDSKLPPQSVISPAPDSSSFGNDTTPIKDCKNGQCKDEGILQSTYGCEKSDDEIVDSESDIVVDSDDDLSLDDTDSDTGEKSHEGSKKSKWFRDFFASLNRLSTEEITSSVRRWHCPACQDGPGAIDWYDGLQPLLIHSRTIKSRRVRLHRLFAETLEEECYRRRAPLIMASEAQGVWEGLDKKVKDHEIVWPPMVLIMNTIYEKDGSNKVQDNKNMQLLAEVPYVVIFPIFISSGIVLSLFCCFPLNYSYSIFFCNFTLLN